MRLVSCVPDHEGFCKPVWLNTNQVHRRFGPGITGFFRLTRRRPWWPWPVAFGPEFHGLILPGGSVISTATDGVQPTGKERP
jgi:hypothetical protein